jgi:hypothetical protein
MLQIENKDTFGKVIANALSKIELTVTDAKTKTRWINAVAKAVAEIFANGVFMTWMEDSQSLLIWSQKSNQIYTSNGVCQCRAFEQGVPCFHRCAARLVRIYLEAESVPVTAEEIPYLKPTIERKAERIAGIRIN